MALKRGCRDLVADAMARIETVSAKEALAMAGDPEVVFVDIRDVRELAREGKIPGAVHAPRGMLEFWVDPESPYYKDVFQEGRRFVLYCQSAWRSALATATLADMGLPRVCHLEGGFNAWKEAGGEVERKDEKDG